MGECIYVLGRMTMARAAASVVMTEDCPDCSESILTDGAVLQPPSSSAAARAAMERIVREGLDLIVIP